MDNTTSVVAYRRCDLGYFQKKETVVSATNSVSRIQGHKLSQSQHSIQSRRPPVYIVYHNYKSERKILVIL